MSDERDKLLRDAIDYLNEQYSRTIDLADNIFGNGELCNIVGNEIMRVHDRIKKAVVFIERIKEALEAYEGSA